MTRTLALIVLLLRTVNIGGVLSRIRVDPDGGYTNIVVKISDKANENACPALIKYIKVGSVGISITFHDLKYHRKEVSAASLYQCFLSVISAIRRI